MAVKECLPSGLDKLISENDKVFVDLWASWCMPCFMMSPIFEEVSEDPEFANLTFAKIQMDDDETIVMKYSVRSVPTFLYFENGELKDRIIGAVNESELRTFVKEKM